MIKIIHSDRIILIFLILFLLLTNTYYGEHNISSSATSSFYYLNIANSYPGGMSLGNTAQTYIHGERFLISYFVGFISNFLNINSFYIFQVFTYFTISFLVVINYKIISKIIPQKNYSLLFFSLFLLNPYIVRYSLSNPVMINDLAFTASISLLFLSFLNKKNILFYIALFLAIISRQTSILIILALIFSLALPYKNKFINLKKIFFSFLLFMTNYLISQQYLAISNITVFYDYQFFGLFDFFQKDFQISKFLNFLFLPFLSFGFLFSIIIMLLLKKKIFLTVNEINIFFIILLILLVAQPFFAGPAIAGKNIIRLSTAGYTSVIFLICLNLKNLTNLSKKIYIIYFIIVLFWSLHPTFSKIKIFETLKVLSKL
jgi:hypothetical protein